MDQLLKSLNDLHQAASSVCLHLQQIPASLAQGGKSNTNNSSTSPLAFSNSSSISSHKRTCSQKAGRRVHVAPPFAAINNNFVVRGSGGGQGPNKGGKGNGKDSSSSKQGDEDEERILISEVSGYCCWARFLASLRSLDGRVLVMLALLCSASLPVWLHD
jgi:hypothetical protein